MPMAVLPSRRVIAVASWKPHRTNATSLTRRLRIDFERADVLGRRDRRLGAHEQLLRCVLERARRRRNRGLADRGNEVVKAQTSCGERNLVDAHLDGLGSKAVRIGCSDALDGRQLVLDDVVDEVRQLAFGQLCRRDRHLHDGLWRRRPP